MLAFTRSTTPPPPKTVAGDVALPPENEAAEHKAGTLASPDEYLDFKQSSNSVVTEAQVKRAQAQAAEVAPAASGLAWQQLGPYNVGGRVTDVVADRFTPNAAFAAVSGGGIWRTTDGGANWTPIWPDTNTQTMGAFAQATGQRRCGPARARPTRPAAA